MIIINSGEKNVLATLLDRCFFSPAQAVGWEPTNESVRVDYCCCPYFVVYDLLFVEDQEGLFGGRLLKKNGKNGRETNE